MAPFVAYLTVIQASSLSLVVSSGRFFFYFPTKGLLGAFSSFLC